MNSVLDRTPPCPNVDVRRMHRGMNPAMVQGPNQPGAPGNNPQHMPGNQQENPGAMHPASFLDNPTHFLAQQAAFVNNSLNTSSKQHEMDGAVPQTDGLSSIHSSPIARLTPGRSPPVGGKSPGPAMGRYPPLSSPTPLGLPSPASQSTPQMTPPQSRRSSMSSHSNTVSPCVTPQSNLKSPLAALINESPCSANDSSSSTATAPSDGGSFSQSPTSSCTTPVPQSPSSGQKINSRLSLSPISPRGPLGPPGVEMGNKFIAEQELQKLTKSPKGSKVKGAAQNKGKLNQNQMNLSFSNALEFQQLLANKYGTGNFPASSLLTAAAKAQGNNANPLTQAVTQLQQGLSQCKPKGKGRKSGKSGTSNNNNNNQKQNAAAAAAQKDDFHGSSFLVNDSGQVEGGDALIAALLGNPNLTNCNQAQLLLQHMSNLNGQNNDSDEVRMDAEQLAVSQMAMLNMAANLMSCGNHSNSGVTTSSKDSTCAALGNQKTVMTGLDVAHNAIINAFNASNMESPEKKPRTKRRRSAPQGDPSMCSSAVTPTKCSRPRSAPGGNVLPQHLFLDSCISSSCELKNASHVVSMATNTAKSNPPSGTEGMPPMSVSASTTVTNSISQVISTACVAQPSTTANSVTVPSQLQNPVITPEQLSQLQLGMLNPQLNAAQLNNTQLLELQQQLLSQQQHMLQGQNQIMQGNDLQQHMGLLQAMNPMLLQQQLAQFQQQTGGLNMDMLTQLQLSQLAMGGGQLPEQALTQIVQGNTAQTDIDKEAQHAQLENYGRDTDTCADTGVANQQANSDDNNKPAENTATTISPEKSKAAGDAGGNIVATPTRTKRQQGNVIVRT